MTAPLAFSDDRLTRLVAAFKAAGCEAVEPAILQPAAVYLETAGEDVGGRLFMTEASDGRDLCLRPDYTVPVCRLHLARPDRTPASYAYCGPVFRQRAGEVGEFLQAGVELLGDADHDAADARALSLALEALRTLGTAEPDVLVGDESLFASLVAALGVGRTSARRLRRAFGDRARLTSVIARLAAGAGETTSLERRAAVVAALGGSDRAAAVRLVEDLIAATGGGAVGRSAHEIAERFLDLAAESASTRPPGEIAATLDAFLAIACPATEAADRLAAFAAPAGLDIASALAAFRRRLALVEASGVDTRRLAFAADFGRNLDYYTGFVFELRPAGQPAARPLVGGGRYDGLLALLGAGMPVPAVGFALWLDRLGFRSPA